MTATLPEWLARREGELKSGVHSGQWLVMLNGTPQYRLVIAPAKGRFTCAISQTNNGRRLDLGIDYPSVEAALLGGLEELRQALGW